MLYSTTQRTPCEITRINRVCKEGEKKDILTSGDSGTIYCSLKKPIVLSKVSNFPPLSNFVIRINKSVIIQGKVTEAISTDSHNSLAQNWPIFHFFFA